MIDDMANFEIKENEGPVFLLTPEDGIVEEPLTDANDLYEGLKIAAPTLFGYVEAEVVFKDDGKLWWESESTYGPLEFAIDERNCWTTSASFKKGIKAARLTTDNGKVKLPVIK